MEQHSRIYVDVGAHRGAALTVAMHPRFGFTQLHAVEPSADCCAYLRLFRDQRLTVHEMALSDQVGSATLFASGSVGGSLFEDKSYKPQHDPSEQTIVETADATAWIAQYTEDDQELVLKMNCEGGEAAILASLGRSGLLQRISSLLIDFDVRKVESLADQEPQLQRQLSDADVNYVDRRTYEGLSVPDAVERWLDSQIPRQDASVVARLNHAIGRDQPPGVVWHRAVARTARRIGLGGVVDRAVRSRA